MNIISSSYSVETPTESDGRAWVTETRVMNDGNKLISSYLADVGQDYAVHLALMVQSDNDYLSEVD